MNCTIRVAKTKALISFAVICTFVLLVFLIRCFNISPLSSDMQNVVFSHKMFQYRSIHCHFPSKELTLNTDKLHGNYFLLNSGSAAVFSDMTSNVYCGLTQKVFHWEIKRTALTVSYTISTLRKHAHAIYR